MPHSGTDFLTATVSLILGCAGAGILSFPWALAASRLPAFACGTVIVLLACCAGMLVLVEHVFAAVAVDNRNARYELVLLRAFGQRSANAATVAILVQQFGSMVGFLVAIGDFASPFGLPRVVVVPTAAFTIMWPLSLVRSLRSLWLPNVLSIVAVCAVPFVVVLRAATASYSSGHHEACGQYERIELLDWPTSATQLFECFPILIFGFNGHLQTAIVAAEVHRSLGAGAATRRVMLAAVLAALGVCTALYSTTAVAGVACYGDGVRNDILANLGHAASAGADPLAALAGGAMAIHLSLAFPILLFPLLVSLDALLAPQDSESGCGHGCGRGSDASSGEGSGGTQAPLAASSTAASLQSHGTLPLLPSPADSVEDGGRHPPPAPTMAPTRWLAARSGLVIALSVALALAAGRQLNLVFSTLGARLRGSLTCPG